MLPCGTLNETYGQDMAIIRTRLQWLLAILGCILLLVVPLFASYYVVSLVNKIAITIIAVLGLQLVMGYCGLISFGQVAFMAVGAYTSAILTSNLGWPFWVALPVSGIVAGLVGVIGGAPSLRIKGFYLALATLAIHYIIGWLVLHLDITGGSAGIHAPAPTVGHFAFDTEQRMFYIIAPVMLFMTYLAKNLTRHRVGRAFVAIRDNDLAAKVMGINLYYYKLLAFFIACSYAGIAGSLLAHWYLVVHPEQFLISDALFFIGMVIVGGLGSIAGVFFGVIIISLLDEVVLLASPVLAAAFPAIGTHPAASISVSVFALVIILFLIYQPRGLAHRWEIFKGSYRLFPFAN